MTSESLKARIDALLQDIDTAGETRYTLQPRLHALLHDMEVIGTRVPPRLRQLDHDLLDEAVEAQFDNLPI